MIADLFYMFLTFFKIGLFTIGGGYAMIPLIQADVIKNNWLTMEALTDFIAIAESTPGPFAINIATFIGMNQYGILGAAITTLGIVLPSFLIILLVAKWFLNFKDNRFVKAGLSGLRPAVVGLISAAVLTISQEVFFTSSVKWSDISRLFSSVDIFAVLIFTIVFIIHIKWKAHPIKLILLSAALGILFYGGSDLIKILWHKTGMN